jgi:hypothetical protein
MQYIIKDINGNEHGPIDNETLAKWIEEDRITAETPVRSSLVTSWRTIGDLAFLQELLAEQAERRKQSASIAEKSGSMLKNAKKRLSTKFTPPTTSRFENKRSPQYATMMPRIMSGLYDLVIFLILAAMIYAAGMAYAYYYPASKTDSSKQIIAEEDNKMIPIEMEEKRRYLEIKKRYEAAIKRKRGDELAKVEAAFAAEFKEEELNCKRIRKALHENHMTANCPPYTFADKNAAYQTGSIWLDTTTDKKYVCLSGAPGMARWIEVEEMKNILTTCFSTWAIIVLVLSALLLGYYSQTFGMWFWGIFIARTRIAEVYFLRAFIFAFVYPFCFLFTPLFVYIFHRGLHEILCGVRLVRVYSKRQKDSYDEL